MFAVRRPVGGRTTNGTWSVSSPARSSNAYVPLASPAGISSAQLGSQPASSRSSEWKCTAVYSSGACRKSVVSSSQRRPVMARVGALTRRAARRSQVRSGGGSLPVSSSCVSARAKANGSSSLPSKQREPAIVAAAWMGPVAAAQRASAATTASSTARRNSRSSSTAVSRVQRSGRSGVGASTSTGPQRTPGRPSGATKSVASPRASTAWPGPPTGRDVQTQTPSVRAAPSSSITA